MTNKLLSLATAVILVGLLTLLSDPFMFWMPMGIQLMILLGIAVLVTVWAGFVIYERAHDERESLHTLHAGRVAYLSGIAILTIALIYQGLTHTIDPWILVALGVMVVAKIAARFYLEHYC